MRKYFFLFLFILFILTHINPVWAANKVEVNHAGFISQRQNSWPNWHLPAPLEHPGVQDDLFYPDWFEGEWKVISFDLTDLNQKPVTHSARFVLDSSKRLVADRQFNAESLGKAIWDDELINLKNNLNSPNRQFAEFTRNRYLEIKIIGREVDNTDENIFSSDELTLQIFYLNDVPEVKQVEIISSFSKCNSDKNIYSNKHRYICGEQWQAIYPEPGSSLILSPVSYKRYKLIMSSL